MAKKKVTTTTTVVEEIIDDGKPRPFHATLLIDNSGSMRGWEDRIVSGVNEYVSTLQHTSKEGKFAATVSVWFFDSITDLRIEKVRERVNVNEWRPVALGDFTPTGYTPLYDAVNAAIDSLDKMTGIDKALVVLTDGGENSSKNSAANVAAKMKRFQSEGYVVVYLGANQDAWETGSSFGTVRTQTSGYTMTAQGLNAAWAGASGATMRYASTRSAKAADFTAAELAGMTGEEEQK